MIPLSAMKSKIYIPNEKRQDHRVYVDYTINGQPFTYTIPLDAGPFSVNMCRRVIAEYEKARRLRNSGMEYHSKKERQADKNLWNQYALALSKEAAYAENRARFITPQPPNNPTNPNEVTR